MWYLDELNTVSSEDERKSSVRYEEYFSAMRLSVKQIKKRVDLAKELEYALFILFLAWHYGADEDAAQDDFVERYISAVEKYDDVDKEGEFVEYIVLLAALLRDATRRHENDPYYTSFDRATFVAANEANTALNNIEHAQAVRDGARYKKWHTERDSRVRLTHIPLEGETIPIDELFDVGGVSMLFPKDVLSDPDNPNLASEVSNCRCSISYI